MCARVGRAARWLRLAGPLPVNARSPALVLCCPQSYIEEVSEQYADLREEFYASLEDRKYLSLADARKRALAVDWKDPVNQPVKPKVGRGTWSGQGGARAQGLGPGRRVQEAWLYSVVACGRAVIGDSLTITWREAHAYDSQVRYVRWRRPA